MTFQELKSIVVKGENTFVEFKRKASHPEKIMREIVAFANTHGGKLFIGVDDNGTIPGLKCAQEEAYVLEAAIERYCKPNVEYKMEYVRLSDRTGILTYHIEESQNKPLKVLENFQNDQGTVYVRVDDKSVKASKEMREILKRTNKQKDVKFHYGDKEKILFQHLSQNEFITLKKFAELAHIPPFIASRTLVILVLANVINIIPREGEDYYVMK